MHMLHLSALHILFGESVHHALDDSFVKDSCIDDLLQNKAYISQMMPCSINESFFK